MTDSPTTTTPAAAEGDILPCNAPGHRNPNGGWWGDPTCQTCGGTGDRSVPRKALAEVPATTPAAADAAKHQPVTHNRIGPLFGKQVCQRCRQPWGDEGCETARAAGVNAPAADDAATRAALDRLEPLARDYGAKWRTWRHGPAEGASRDTAWTDTGEAFMDALDVEHPETVAAIFALARRALALPLAECEAWAAAVRAREAQRAKVPPLSRRGVDDLRPYDLAWDAENEAYDTLRAAVVATGGRATDGEAPHA